MSYARSAENALGKFVYSTLTICTFNQKKVGGTERERFVCTSHDCKTKN